MSVNKCTKTENTLVCAHDRVRRFKDAVLDTMDKALDSSVQWPEWY